MTQRDAMLGVAGCELARKNPQIFSTAVEEYCTVLQLAVEEAVSGTDRHTFTRVRTLARKLGELDCVPQDFIVVHLSALATVVKNKPHEMAKACVWHSRLLLVKMIGELALFYREQARAEGR
jgi:hypothetical protein